MQEKSIINPQMTIGGLIEQLRSILDLQQQKRLLNKYASFDWNELLYELKCEVDTLIRKTDGLPIAERLVTLMFHCALTSGDDYHRALALRAQGNYYLIGQRSNREAVECYQAAEKIYIQHNDTLGAAQAMIGTTGALQELGRFAEAEAILQKIISVFDAHKQWLPLSNAYLNLAALYNYIGRDEDALQIAEQALSLVKKLGDQGKRLYPLLENNRALSLRNLGQFEESIDASRHAREINLELGQTLEATRALSNMAFTYFLLDQYNQSLHLYEQCRNEYLSGGKQRDAANADLEYIDCLLQLRRFPQALKLCHTIESEFRSFDAQPQLARLYMMQAVAYASKKPAEYDKALAVLSKSVDSSQSQENRQLMTQAKLRAAFIYFLQGNYEESLDLAQSCAKILHQQSLSGDEANAYLIGARAALHLGKPEMTHTLVRQASAIAAQNPQTYSFLQYQIHVLLGDLARLQKEHTHAYAEYDSAIQQVEQLRSRLMVEFNADFLEDKQNVYQESVHLCITKLQKPEQAWNYVERAKSRALIDMLAHRIDLKIHSRDPADDALVEELEHLRSERNRLYRQLQALAKPNPFGDSRMPSGKISQNEMPQRTILQGNVLQQGAGHPHIPSGEMVQGERTQGEATQGEIVAQFITLQEEIGTQWNRLLSRNADYERDALLAHVSLADIQAYLEPDCCLLEYFIAKNKLFVFLITNSTIEVYPLGQLSKIKSILTFFQMNLQAVPLAKQSSIRQLTRRAQSHLQGLYNILLAPFIADIQPYKHLMIVPHNFLHTLPFHALYNGTHYLIEQYEISYLPCATLLHHCHQFKDSSVRQNKQVSALVLGHTQGGTLPGRANESQVVAQLLDARYLLDDSVTLSRLMDEAPEHQIVHLATHGQFNASNPLFSGLALEDGELTTFDIFNMRLNASLVVLSACETAKALVGGGDELLGLSRALFYAGARSLVVSQWKVEDESTAQLMVAFYTHLKQGCTKRQALQNAQCQLLRPNEPIDDSTDKSTPKSIMTTHPFFWSAFFLMGDSNIL